MWAGAALRISFSACEQKARWAYSPCKLWLFVVPCHSSQLTQAPPATRCGPQAAVPASAGEGCKSHWLRASAQASDGRRRCPRENRRRPARDCAPSSVPFATAGQAGRDSESERPEEARARPRRTGRGEQLSAVHEAASDRPVTRSPGGAEGNGPRLSGIHNARWGSARCGCFR